MARRFYSTQDVIEKMGVSESYVYHNLAVLKARKRGWKLAFPAGHIDRLAKGIPNPAETYGVMDVASIYPVSPDWVRLNASTLKGFRHKGDWAFPKAHVDARMADSLIRVSGEYLRTDDVMRILKLSPDSHLRQSLVRRLNGRKIHDANYFPREAVMAERRRRQTPDPLRIYGLARLVGLSYSGLSFHARGGNAGAIGKGGRGAGLDPGWVLEFTAKRYPSRLPLVFRAMRIHRSFPQEPELDEQLAGIPAQINGNSRVVNTEVGIVRSLAEFDGGLIALKAWEYSRIGSAWARLRKNRSLRRDELKPYADFVLRDRMLRSALERKRAFLPANLQSVFKHWEPIE